MKLLRIFDGKLAEGALQKVADYHRVSLSRIEEIIDRWVNTELFDKVDGAWIPKFVLA